ncbi:MAG: hypothetical protein O7D31_11075 [Alphaproteobacteria bacterium]|nr:hypothetical protein [Alphaproteobacteria bacterium]
MRKFVLATAIIVVIGITAHHANAQSSLSNFRYLGSALNVVVDASLLGPRITPEQFANATTVACQALKRLSTDEEFRKRLFGHKHSQRGVNKALANIEQLTQFLVFEREVLIKMGVSERTATQITQNLIEYKNAAVNEKWSAENTMGRIRKSAGIACSLSAQATKKIESSERWVLLIRIGKVVGGAAVIVGNVVLSAPSAGLTAASVAMGTVLLASGL